MANLVGFSQAGVDAILATYRALWAYSPELVAHFDAALTEVRFARGWCDPGAAACVRGTAPRVAFFELAPEHLMMRETGRILVHEARHWQRDPWGNWYVLPHSCSDRFCDRPSERARDFVYAGDAEALPHIHQALRNAGYDPDKPWILPPAPSGPSIADVAVSVGLAAVIVGGLALMLGDD